MKAFLNLKIANKLVSCFLIVALIAVVMGGVGLLNIQRLQAADALLFEQNLGGMGYTGDIYGHVEGLRFLLLEYVTSIPEEKKEAALKKIQEAYSEVEELMAGYAELEDQNDPEIVAQFEDIMANWNLFKEYYQKSLSLMSEGKMDEAKTNFLKGNEIGITLAEGISNLLMLNFSDGQSRFNSNKAVAKAATISAVIICIVGVVISVVLGLMLSRVIGKPVALAAKVANMLAAGNLDTSQMQTGDNEALYARKDEVGELARAFRNLTLVTARQANLINQIEHGDLTVDVEVRSNKDTLGKSLSGLVLKLNDLIAGIVSAADQVASGAELVSNSSITLSQGTTEQASAVEELSASLEEVSKQTNLNAQNAEKASQMASSAKKEAEQGNAQMDALLKAMDAISASSSDIGNVIKVIEDIAFQTNILALNASVEAARAGQYGRGFAVVAEEVRALAGKSANAAKDTTVMIDGSIRNVQAGIQIANDTAESLKRIVAEVSNATELMGGIAVASKDQAATIEQLNQGIMQVSHVVQNNAATSEESAAASEELTSQAAQLKEAVGVFIVKNIKA